MFLTEASKFSKGKTAYIYTESQYAFGAACDFGITCDPLDCSLPGSPVLRIFHARILEWVAIPSSRGSSQPRDQSSVSVSPALQANSLPLSHYGTPHS